NTPSPIPPAPQPPIVEKSLIETDINIKNTKIADLGYVSYLVIHFTKADLNNYEVYVDGQPITLSKVNDGGKIAKWEIRRLDHKELKIVRKSDGKIGIYDLKEKTIVK
ncbi:MAG: hypothetical protein Q4A78_05640, partial [Peptostreptococcaceae bacterium]|nr:hypothetical protein [Peptostreptococcaceae bacterium]